MKFLKSGGIIVLGLAGMAVMTPGIASAAHRPGNAGNGHPSGRHNQVVTGTLTDFGPADNPATTSATITPANGSAVTFTLTAKTRGVYVGTTNPAPTPVAGDPAAALVRYSPSGTTAVALEYTDGSSLPAPGKNKHKGTRPFAGSVQSDNGSQLVIADWRGATDTFTLGSSTQCFAGDAPTSCGSYTNVERVLVVATQQSDGSWLADVVYALPPPTMRFEGTVQSDNGTALVIVDRKANTDTFTLGSSTQCFGPDRSAVDCSTFTSVARVVVVATQQSDGSWLAVSVTQLPLPTKGFRGTVQSDDGNVLMITDSKGNTDSFTLGPNTQCFAKHRVSVSCGTYAAAEKVSVVATEQGDGSWLADGVVGRSAPPVGNE